MFYGLREVIENNLFEVEIPADNVFVLGDNIVNDFSIPINFLQDALSLYDEIRDRMRDYLPQFFSTAANIVNRNYKEPQSTDDDEVPF
jgi:hypothetical protein